MQSVINSIINHIRSSVPQIRYVSRNWNQLSYEQPPLLFPCALVDIESISLSEIKHGAHIANATISITVANSVLHRDNPKASDDFLALVQQIVDSANLFSPPNAQPLIVSAISKAYSDRSYDVFSISLSTAWTHRLHPPTALPPSPVISIK